MDTLKDCIFSLCISMVLGAVLNYLLPEGSLQQLFKMVFSVFFLSALCMPIFKANNWEFTFSLENTQSIESTKNMTEKLVNTTEKQLEEEIEKSAKEILEKNGINFQKIFIKVNIEDDGSISISEFSVTIDAKEDLETVKTILIKELGIEPELNIQEETGSGNA